MVAFAMIFAFIATTDVFAQPAADFWLSIDRRFPYDDRARRQRMSGSGVYRAEIDRKSGRVVRVVVVKSTGFKHLDEGAVQTVMRWRARPNADRSSVEVPVTFLDRPGHRP